MTGEEFEAAYAESSGVTVEFLHAHGRRAQPCDCGDESCQGWQMAHRDEDRPARPRFVTHRLVRNGGTLLAEYVTVADQSFSFGDTAAWIGDDAGYFHEWRADDGEWQRSDPRPCAEWMTSNGAFALRPDGSMSFVLLPPLGCTG